MREESQFFRRFLVLQQLSGSRHGRRSVGQLQRVLSQQGIETTRRTIERDLLWLTRFFPLTCDNSRPRGWFWTTDRESIQLPRMDSLTALALLLAYETLRPIFPPALLENWERYQRDAERALAESSLRDWRRHVTVLSSSVPSPPQISDWTLSRVLEALESRCQLAFTYHAQARTDGKKHRVSPWGVVLQEGALYLVAYHPGRETPLLYACHRMSKVRLQKEPAQEMPADFSLQAFAQANLRFAEQGAPITLRIQVKREIAHLVEERPIGTHQAVESRGRTWVTFRAEVEDSEALRWWILSYGTGLKVLAPADLVESLQETTAAMAKLYARRSRESGTKMVNTGEKIS
ncbi:WYL domain-containing protein [Acidithiobacillus ferrooxidans]|uniref:helix-turn-helix transcriptional regulator n=1 Tax=Acidithiobacillus ferrooxidans TaxID=920 RepID=UPI001C073AA7|nr:WYL domain-containing protein [Acidithiobacillus ferrooxidans]MBU2772508.1 WYL domain-containing protein [Acidithiobacillus ferrooxidans]